MSLQTFCVIVQESSTWIISTLWVRNAYGLGILPVSPSEILSRLRVQAEFLEMDADLGFLLFQLVLLEARFHCSAASLGSQAVLQHLVRQLLEADIVTTAMLTEMTDGALEHLLLASSITATEAQRLWYQPDQLIVQKIGDESATKGYTISVEKLYLSEPLVDGKPITQTLPQTAALLNEIRQLLGTYLVYHL